MAKVTVNIQVTFDVEENPRIPMEAVKGALEVEMNEYIRSAEFQVPFNSIYDIPDLTVTVWDTEDTVLPMRLAGVSVAP